MKLEQRTIILISVLLSFITLVQRELPLKLDRTTLLVAMFAIAIFATIYAAKNLDVDVAKSINEASLFVKNKIENMKLEGIYPKKTNGKQNHGVAKVTVNGVECSKLYFAISSDTDIILPKEYEMILCNDIEKVKKNLKVKRLTPNLKWGEYNYLGFAESKINCCERKILAYILEEFIKKRKLKYEDISVAIYTEYEPCIYCYDVMQELMDKGMKITLGFDEMVNVIKNYNNKKT